MSYRFFIGGSGSGKSRALQEEIIERAQADPARQFIIVVPDQFTMQTQKEVVERHPRKGIMNIDVQSFGRLCYRIGGEVGGPERIVLDDTGKNLILRHLAAGLGGELTTIGSSLKKTGYIHEVKSVISEFMQYGLGTKDVEKLIDYSSGHPLLRGKLKDVNRLYAAFEEYLGEKYITKEERLDVLASDIAHSENLKGAVIAFDGFTGFTPVQNNVITQMLGVCSELIFTVILPAEELESYRGENDDHLLFSLSMKTMRSVSQLAHDAGVPHGEDRLFFGRPVRRYEGRPVLAHLEQSLFRRGAKPYPALPGDTPGGTAQSTTGPELSLFTAADPGAELKEIFSRIRKLCCEEGMAYREIAVVSGDLERYVPDAQRLAAEYGIPLFIDRNRKLALNPFTEFLRGVFLTVRDGFRVEHVLQLYKSGLAGLTPEEVCVMENYLYATGVRSAKAWERAFTRRPRYMEGDDAAMEEVNGCRERTMRLLAPLCRLPKETDAGTISAALYEILRENGIYEALEAYADSFRESGDEARQKEYEQIYRIILELTEQITDLLSGETLTIAEYLEILEAGISEIKVGVLPQDVDRVVLGDMERTRLKPIRVLFFAGCNDGVIPGSNVSGGLISDTDREFLSLSGMPLAPTPRDRMYIQRLYLYHVLSRPSERLILSCSARDRSGASVRPSYLLGRIRALFPFLAAEDIGGRNAKERVEAAGRYTEELPGMLSEYALGTLPAEEEPVLSAIFADAGKRDPELADTLVSNAFYRYLPERLSGKCARGLYGTVLSGSVSRLEQYASCAYRHFLRYGMHLKPREGNLLTRPDIGTLCHGILEGFGKVLAEEGLRWSEVEEEKAEQILEKVSLQVLGEFGTQRIYQDAATAWRYEQMLRILRRSVSVMRYQLSRGKFEPAAYEQGFEECLQIPGGEMRLAGKIDRIDRMDSGDRRYLKVVDYKSGKRSLDYAELYAGRQLQLPVYLAEAGKLMQKSSPGKEVVPAAVYYYNLQDPILDPATQPADLYTVMRSKGLALDLPEVLHGIDDRHSGRSDVADLSWKNDGTPDRYARVASPEEMTALLHFTERKLKQLGAEILSGEKGVCPAKKEVCESCDYRECCPFDLRTPGYRTGGESLTQEEAKKRITQTKEEPIG